MINNIYKKYRFLIARRITQISVMVLYVIANVYGINFLTGNLSSSLLLNTVPLSDPYAVLQMAVAGAIISVDILLGAFIISIFYLIVGGRAFCSWVCPVNIITDFANYLRKKFGFNQIQKKQPASRNIRYWVIAISFIISFFMGITAFELISPISMIHRGIIFGLGFGWATIVIIFLFDLFVLKNGWRVASRVDWSTMLLIQAPPCLVGRAQKSIRNKPIGLPSASLTSYTSASGVWPTRSGRGSKVIPYRSVPAA